MQCLLLSFFKKGSISSSQPPNPHPLLKKPKKACNMESFATIVNGFQVLTIVVKFSILYIWGVPGYVSERGVHLIFNSFTHCRGKGILSKFLGRTMFAQMPFFFENMLSMRLAERLQYPTWYFGFVRKMKIRYSQE